MADLTKAPDEPLSAYMARITGLHGRLNNNLAQCRAENEELAVALDMSAENFLQLAERAEREKKLHPLFQVLAYQTITSVCAYVEERVANGKPYVTLPVAFISAAGSALAYLTGNGQTGDLLLAATNAGIGVLNTRYSSRKGHEAKLESEAEEAKEKAAKEAKEAKAAEGKG